MKQIYSTLLLCLLALSGWSQTDKQRMTIVDFLNVPSLSDPQLSPDGTHVLYTLAESDWEANRQVGHIWCAALEGDTRQFTFGEGGESQARWSPDGKHISFLTQRGKDKANQLYLMPVDGGEAHAVTQHPTSIRSYAWAPDGTSIYFLAEDALSELEQKKLDRKDDVIAYDENYQQRHLWRLNLAGESTERMTSGDYSILGFELSQDGSQLLVQQGPDPLYDHRPASEIALMNADGSNVRVLTDNQIGESGASLSPDGRQVLFIAFANAELDFYYNDKLFLLSTDGANQLEVPLPDAGFEVIQAKWAADGNSIFLHVNQGVTTQLLQYELKKKKLTPLTTGNHSLIAWNYHSVTGKHILGVNRAGSPGDLQVLSGQSLTPITHHFDYLAEAFHLPKQEVIQWTGADGVTVEGILHYPIDYVEGQRYPLAVQTHGGPASSDRVGFSRRITHYHPVLAGKGYAILQPNYRGSTGYGDDFLRDMVGSYFRQAHLDVMTGVDYLIDRGIVDPDRMVKMGWSAGGHMTNKIITHTDRFKAASSGAGAINWVSMYGQSDVRTYRTPWFGGTPWQENAPVDVYWANSPLKDIAQVTTPTLILVGEKDPRVPSPQSLELFRALKSLGVPTHLYIAPREPHGWRELQHRLHKINVELEWFAKYALAEGYDWEMAP